MTPYQTMANLPYKKQVEEICRVIKEQSSLRFDENFIALGERIVTPRALNTRLMTWQHPIMMDDKVYVDMRPFLNNEDRVKNATEYLMACERATMEYVWNHEPDVFYTLSPALSLFYAEWMTAAIASRYSVTITDRTKFFCVFFYYYMRIIHDAVRGKSNSTTAIDKDSLIGLVEKKLVTLFKLPPDIVKGILLEIADYTQMDDIDLHCVANMITRVSTTQMGKFTDVVILQLLGSGSWIGHNAVNLSITAVEYPPLFMVLLKNAVTISTLKNKTRFGRAAAAIKHVPTDPIVSTVNSIRSDYIYSTFLNPGYLK